MRHLALVLALAAGCGTTVDVEPVLDYQDWGTPIVVTGKAPGHGDSYRAIYANDLARGGPQFYLGYQTGSIIVKEIRDNNDGQPGDLRYVAIMRKLREPSNALEDEGGWLFTMADDVEAEEREFGFCWARCHAAAPYNGAWYDYTAR